jgi:hypothetical protein
MNHFLNMTRSIEVFRTIALLVFILVTAVNADVYLSPSATDDDAALIQAALDVLSNGETLHLNGDFTIRRTIYLPSNFHWILAGSITLGDNAELDYIGFVGDGIDSRTPTAIAEVSGGATNIDMSGGTYYGNAENNAGQNTTNMTWQPFISRTRLLNFIHVQYSLFRDMTIENASDDNFSLGQNASNNECRSLVSRFAGLSLEESGNGLTDRGEYNKWYDCIAEDSTSDGWTPKCRHSEFHRCIGRRNRGPGFGLFARVDGIPRGQDRGNLLEGNKFYACEAYDNYHSGFSVNICSSNCPGAIVRNNYIEGAFFNNRMTGVHFRNAGGGIVDENEVDILVYGNQGVLPNGTAGDAESGAGLVVEGNATSPVTRIHGSAVAYSNGNGKDIFLGGGGFNCSLTKYYPANSNGRRNLKKHEGIGTTYYPPTYSWTYSPTHSPTYPTPTLPSIAPTYSWTYPPPMVPTYLWTSPPTYSPTYPQPAHPRRRHLRRPT